MKNNKIIFFPKYSEEGPSSRYRIFQYKSFFEKEGFSVKIHPLFDKKYIDRLYFLKPVPPFYYLKRFINRIMELVKVEEGAVVYIEYELLPYFPFLIEKLLLRRKCKVVLDYDDAIFHNYDRSNSRVIKAFLSNKIYSLAKRADLVITGSAYLTETLEKYNSNVVEIPTSLTFEKYAQFSTNHHSKNTERFRIGWIGSKTTSINLSLITVAVKELQKKYNIELILIGFDENQKEMLKGINYTILKWNAEKEVEIVHSFDVGVMPLLNTDFNKGKCGFKLIQYMACGIPTISTPLIANVKINRNKKNLHASNSDEWLQCFEKIAEQKEYYREIVGKENRDIAKSFYSAEANYTKYIGLFSQMGD